HSSSVRTIILSFSCINRLEFRAPCLGGQAEVLSEYVTYGVFQNIQAGIQVGITDDQGAKNLDHFGIRAARLNNQSILKAATHDFFRHVAVTAADSLHHAPALHPENAVATKGGNAGQAIGKNAALALHVLGKTVVFPICFESSAGSDEGVVISAERTVVLARRPLIVLRFQQHNGKRQTDSSERFRQRHDVRRNTGRLKAEEGAGTPATSLNVIHDQQHTMSTADCLEGLEP